MTEKMTNTDHATREYSNNQQREITFDYLAKPACGYFVSLVLYEQRTRDEVLRACSSLLNVLDNQVFGAPPNRTLRRVVSLEQNARDNSYIHMLVESPARANPGCMSESEFLALIGYVWERLGGFEWAAESEAADGIPLVRAVHRSQEAAEIIDGWKRADSAVIQWDLSHCPEDHLWIISRNRLPDQESGFLLRQVPGEAR